MATWSHAPARLGRARGVSRVPWLFAAPALALYAGLLLIPTVVGAFYAFTAWDGITTPQWLGFGNFSEILSDHEGRDALVHTLLLAVAYVVAVNAIGLGLALGLNTTLKTRGLLRALYFFPAVVSPLAVSYIWKYILDPSGPLNEGLRSLGLGGLAEPWLGQTTTALPAVLVVMVWQFAGWHTVIYLAGLQSIQRELYEAAAVDGAGTWRRFGDITWPLLIPAFTMSVVLSLVVSLTTFDQVIALTNGGPAGATETMGTYVYEQAFVNGRFGYSAAVALMLMVVVAISVAVPLGLLRRRQVQS
jgi:raffinose/stachyose/melibiose transport system permease protein